ncbi:tissue factor pathway inhibitor 2 isoform X1 [Pitangus sulphuratus]|nr:tissue factor pathway inhibitor 2 isoform X1 [Pitangus sulphuratus]
MDTGRRLPLPALLLPLACAALAQRSLTEKQRACLLPPDDGPCRALVPRWYYDRHTQSCQEFTYGGCYGNANNFLTFDDCEKNCWTIKKVPKLCRLEADGGPCRSHLRRYAFNLSSMRCEEFIYGGCYGNGNNFRDLQSCVDHCLPERTGPLLCYSPKDEGLCSSSVPRYYYDAKTKSCKEFKYTGCGGNANNFVTEMDCYNVCRKDYAYGDIAHSCMFCISIMSEFQFISPTIFSKYKVGEVLQPSDDLCDPPLDPLEQVHVFTVSISDQSLTERHDASFLRITELLLWMWILDQIPANKSSTGFQPPHEDC